MTIELVLKIRELGSKREPLKAQGEVPPVISEKELAVISAKAGNQLVLLDIRPRLLYNRGHSLGSINVPVDELEIRALIELDKSQIIIIDCLDVPYTVCTLAMRGLLHAGFGRVSVLNRKPATPPCGICPS